MDYDNWKNGLSERSQRLRRKGAEYALWAVTIALWGTIAVILGGPLLLGAHA